MDAAKKAKVTGASGDLAKMMAKLDLLHKKESKAVDAEESNFGDIDDDVHEQDLHFESSNAVVHSSDLIEKAANVKNRKTLDVIGGQASKTFSNPVPPNDASPQQTLLNSKNGNKFKTNSKRDAPQNTPVNSDVPSMRAPDGIEEPKWRTRFRDILRAGLVPGKELYRLSRSSKRNWGINFLKRADEYQRNGDRRTVKRERDEQEFDRHESYRMERYLYQGPSRDGPEAGSDAHVEWLAQVLILQCADACARSFAGSQRMISTGYSFEESVFDDGNSLRIKLDVEVPLTKASKWWFHRHGFHPNFEEKSLAHLRKLPGKEWSVLRRALIPLVEELDALGYVAHFEALRFKESNEGTFSILLRSPEYVLDAHGKDKLTADDRNWFRKHDVPLG